jgi:tetratricopeptide (TPR) repeat protein
MNKNNHLDISLRQLNLNEIMKLFYNIEGVKKADKGAFDSALEFFSKAIKLQPKDSTSYFNRASLRMYLGDVEGAKSDLNLLKSYNLKKILSWSYLIIISLAILLLYL